LRKGKRREVICPICGYQFYAYAIDISCPNCENEIPWEGR